MSIPQDTRAPHRQQRWIEIENVGPVTIPAFGACEIVGSHRPDQSQYTPLDGRTVIQARRSTRDNPCATIVNGPCEIPVYESRRVGTMDDPMLALVASAYYPTGTTVGVKSGSFILEAGYCGYLIIGDWDGGTATMRVKRWEDCGQQDLMVKAYECIYPGDMNKTATIQRWEPSTKCWVDDPAKPTRITICDCNKWILALPGECFKVERDNTCDSAYGGDACYRPSFPFGLTRRVKIKSQINCGACGPATLLKTGNNDNDCQDPTESECEIQVCNSSNRKIACDADEYATLHISPGECGTGTKPTCYGWLVPNCRPLRAEATLTEALCGSGAKVTDVEFKDVCRWVPRHEVTTAKNPLSLQGCPHKQVILGWNDEDCGWDVIQVTDEQLPDWIIEILCGTNECLVNKQTAQYPYYGHFCHCDDQVILEGPTGVEGIELDVVEDITAGGGGSGTTVLTGASVNKDIGSEAETCEIAFSTASISSGASQIKKRKICALCTSSSGSTYSDGPAFTTIGAGGSAGSIAFEKVEMLSDAIFECDPCPQLTLRTIDMYVLCSSDTESEYEPVSCECVDCEESPS